MNITQIEPSVNIFCVILGHAIKYSVINSAIVSSKQGFMSAPKAYFHNSVFSATATLSWRSTAHLVHSKRSSPDPSYINCKLIAGSTNHLFLFFSTSSYVYEFSEKLMAHVAWVHAFLQCHDESDVDVS